MDKKEWGEEGKGGEEGRKWEGRRGKGVEVNGFVPLIEILNTPLLTWFTIFGEQVKLYSSRE